MTSEQDLTEKLKVVMGQVPPQLQLGTAFAAPPPDDLVKSLDLTTIIDWLDKFDPASLDTFVTILGMVSIVWPPAAAIAAGLRMALPWVAKLLPLLKEALQLFGVTKTLKVLRSLAPAA